MAAVEEKYRRLPGRRRGVISGASLWMGSDHILLVRSAWFREEYKRFYPVSYTHLDVYKRQG